MSHSDFNIDAFININSIERVLNSEFVGNTKCFPFRFHVSEHFKVTTTSMRKNKKSRTYFAHFEIFIIYFQIIKFLYHWAGFYHQVCLPFF